MGFAPVSPEAMAEVVGDLRDYLRDHAGLNTLLCDKQEHTDSQLRLAVNMGLGAFNVLTPISSYTIKSLPTVAYPFLLHEGAIEALIMAGILHSRNQLSYSDGGITVADHAKGGSYQGWINAITSLRRMAAKEKEYKVQLNIEGCYGSIDSEFQSDVTYCDEIY